MKMSNKELVKQLSTISGGQIHLPEKLGVTPGAISGWLRGANMSQQSLVMCRQLFATYQVNLSAMKSWAKDMIGPKDRQRPSIVITRISDVRLPLQSKAPQGNGLSSHDRIVIPTTKSGIDQLIEELCSTYLGWSMMKHDSDQISFYKSVENPAFIDVVVISMIWQTMEGKNNVK